MQQKRWLLLLLCCNIASVRAQQPWKDSLVKVHAAIQKGTLLASESFEKMDSSRWITEMDPQPSSAVYVKNGKLVLDTRGGVTVWFNHLLAGNLVIEYERTVLVGNGINDRLSDLNQFWMAQDTHNKNLFTRSGILESYDSLQLYYVGMGGNTNKTTRFRKYEGNGQRRLLQEYTDTAHVLKANRVYHITTIVAGGSTSFWVDGQCYFIYRDDQPLRQGYFGFRATQSHQEIDHFKIYKIK